MKISKEQLKKIIMEEMTNLKEYGEDDFNPWAPQYSDAEQKAVDAIEAAADAIINMGQSNPDMTDAYVTLFRVLERAGVNIEALARMSSTR